METSSDIRAKKAAAAVNQIKVTADEFFTEDLVGQLRKNGCPYPKFMPKILEDQGIIKRKKGILTFLSNEPIYYGLLKFALDKASEYNIQYANKSKKVENRVEESFEVTALHALASINTTLLIEELKRRGEYRIQLVVTQVIDC